MVKRILYSTFSFVIGFSALAQDPQFTQFYAAPMYLNPAFTGLTYEHRFTANYRQQWAGIKTGFQTLMATYDYNLNDINSGIGGFIMQDRAGTANLVTQQYGVNYAYRIKVNKTSELRLGMSVGITSKRIDFSRLVFNDQLITGTPAPSAQQSDKINYLDLGLGALYNSTNYWFGIAAKHVNQPNVSMVGDNAPLPVSITAHGGYRYIISAKGTGKTKLEEFVSASVNYRRQQLYDQLDIGAYYFKSFINLGLWYRGLPLKKYKSGYTNRESIAILLGLELPDKNFRMGYSYDITISKLGINNSQGSHEISLVYEIASKVKRTKRRLVSCPKF